MNTLLLNGSGIKDPTAYAAIKNCKREGYDMRELRPNPGEIWEVEIGPRYIDMLVLSVSDRNFCNMLQLHDSDMNLGKNVEVVCADGIKYADCEKMSFKFFDAFQEYKKTVPEDTFREIRRSVAEACGLAEFTDGSDVLSEIEAQAKRYKEECKALREQLNDALMRAESRPADTGMLTRAVKAEAERDVYKELYTELVRMKSVS